MTNALAIAAILATVAGAEPTDPPQPETQEPGASSPARPEVDPVSEPPKKEDENDPDKTFTVSGYIEAFYQWSFNGWNDIVDQNDEKSFIAGAHYKVKDKLTISGSYFGGVERSGGAPEGRAWRHGFETWAQLDATDWLALAVDSSTGFERTRFGIAWWASAAVYARAKVREWLYVAARGDSLWEDVASSSLGESEPILLPAKRMTSGTATLDFRPVKGLSARLEYRHDGAQSPLFFRGETNVPNTRRQDTALLGLTAWF